MNKTSNEIIFPKATITTDELQSMLSCGRATAVQIGTNAEARIQIGKRVLWNISKINQYLDAVAE